jgi:hypothetical protein
VRGVGDVDPLGGADPRHCLWHTGALLVSAPPPVTQPVTHPVTGHRTGHAARSGGERVCGLAPVRATRPARGGATGSGCTEPNHGARWGVRAGRLVRRFAGMHRAKKGVRTCLQSGLAGTVGATRSTAPAAVGGAVARGPAPGPRRVRVRYGYTQDPRVPLFASLSGREEPNEQRCTIPGDVPNDPPGSPWRAVGRKIQKLSRRPAHRLNHRPEWGLCLGHQRCRIPEPRGL